MPVCYELPLPPSELSHNADLVHVFEGGDVEVASCIVASPGGILRYWSSVSSSGSYVELSTDVKGEVFCKLAPLEVLPVMLANIFP